MHGTYDVDFRRSYFDRELSVKTTLLLGGFGGAGSPFTSFTVVTLLYLNSDPCEATLFLIDSVISTTDIALDGTSDPNDHHAMPAVSTRALARNYCTAAIWGHGVGRGYEREIKLGGASLRPGPRLRYLLGVTMPCPIIRPSPHIRRRDSWPHEAATCTPQ